MGSLLQIRDVPESHRRVLKARAAAQGESLNSFLLGVISREAARPTVGEVLERAAQRSGRSDESAATVLDLARVERDDELLYRSHP